MATQTGNLALTKSANGEYGWNDNNSANMDTLDTAVGSEHNASGTHKVVHADAIGVGGKLAAAGEMSAPTLRGDAIVLGGVAKSAWPVAVTGASGQVFMTGSVALKGRSGVTVTHNHGSTSYLLKVLPTGADGSRVGEISYVKAANTVTIYNTGEGDAYHAPLLADIELSAL